MDTLVHQSQTDAKEDGMQLGVGLVEEDLEDQDVLGCEKRCSHSVLCDDPEVKGDATEYTGADRSDLLPSLLQLDDKIG